MFMLSLKNLARKGLKDYTFEIAATSPRDQWVKPALHPINVTELG